MNNKDTKTEAIRNRFSYIRTQGHKPPTFESTAEQASYIQLEFQKLAEQLANAEPEETARTWGFEIETPEADRILDNMTREQASLVEFCADGSVSSADGCECDCSSCTYHECNCDNCEDYNDSPDHDCGSSWCVGQYQEIKTLAGGVKTTHPEALTALDSAGLASADITDDCGLHIHIGSADLEAWQVARVLTAYRLLGQILDPIAGRVNGGYYKKHDPQLEEDTRRGYDSDKYTDVNTKWHFMAVKRLTSRDATLEFRQHEGTNDSARIRAWAWLMIQLVEFAKTSKPVYWLGRCQTLGDMITAIR